MGRAKNQTISFLHAFVSTVDSFCPSVLPPQTITRIVSHCVR